MKNAIEHAFVYCPGDIVDIKDLGPCEIALPRPPSGERRKGDRRASTLFSNPAVIPPNPIQAAKLDANTLRKMLEQHHWHIGYTADALGMHRTTLWRHMLDLGLSKHTQ